MTTQFRVGFADVYKIESESETFIILRGLNRINVVKVLSLVRKQN